jgi:hypothetical protein
MDYLKLIKGLKKEIKEAGREKYKSMNILLRFILTIFFIPLRIAHFFGRHFYCLTWLGFKAASAPADYLTVWFEKQKENTGDLTKAALMLVCMPTLLVLQVVLAFFSFSFFGMWVALVVAARWMTVGAVRRQLAINEATFDEE